MKTAYLDTSLVVAILLKEPGAERLSVTLDGYDMLFSSPLLEAELKSTLFREKCDLTLSDLYLERLELVIADRFLGKEISTILNHYYLRGADLYHLATALFVFPKPLNVK